MRASHTRVERRYRHAAPGRPSGLAVQRVAIVIGGGGGGGARVSSGDRIARGGEKFVPLSPDDPSGPAESALLPSVCVPQQRRSLRSVYVYHNNRNNNNNNTLHRSRKMCAGVKSRPGTGSGPARVGSGAARACGDGDFYWDA